MTFDLTQDLTLQTLVFMHRSGRQDRLCVYQNQHYRWLQIGEIVQSVLRLSAPEQPILPYLHPLLLVPFMRPAVRNIIELGLGGGAIQRFFSGLPQQVTSVEYDPEIISCFRSYFAPTQTGPVILQDATDFLAAPPSCDWLIIDLFDHLGGSKLTFNDGFYRQCRQMLGDEGVLSVNLLPHLHLQTDVIKDYLYSHFGQRPLEFAIPGYQNRLLCVSATPLPRLTLTPELSAYAQNFALDLNSFQILS